MKFERLESFIQEYQRRVQETVTLFRAHKNIHPVDWKQAGLPRVGFIDAAQTIRCSFHGIGCYVELPSGPVDWDLGHNGRLDGFDTWRLWQFAEEGTTHFPEFVDEETLEAAFAEAISQGRIKQLYREHRDSLYYLVERVVT